VSATILDIIKSRCDTVESSSSVFYAHDGSASRVRAGQVLFNADDPSDSVYFLVDGDAKGCLGEGDVLVTTSLLRAPAVFGDRDVLAGCPARETVQFVTSGRVVWWERQRFLDAWRHDAELRELLAVDLARRHVASLQLEALRRLPSEARVAHLFHTFQRSSATADKDEIMGASGLSRRAFARCLTALRRAKILSGKGSDLRVDLTSLATSDMVFEAIFHSLRLT